MNKLPLIIGVIVMALVAAVAGCGRTPRYDARLVQADSLMRDFPDSALAIVEAVSPGSLGGEGDRAYRSLLLTQARYRCYVTATGDSAINRALAYYRRHGGEREKLTRAYIYKGAVMEELGHPDSAMLYYKHAEATAAKNDYATLGYVKLRIADLYRLYYADAQICYDKFKEALSYHRLTNNTHLQLDCLLSMAGCSGITGIDNSNRLLSLASELAQQTNDSIYYYLCQELLCRHLSRTDSTLQQAKHIAFNCLENYPDYINSDLLLDLVHIYVSENILDSAYYFLNFVNEQNSNGNLGQISARKYEELSALAQKEGNMALSYQYLNRFSKLSDSINNNKYKYQIQQIENQHNKTQTDENNLAMYGMQWLIVGLVVLLVALTTCFIVYQYRKRRSMRVVMQELAQLQDFNGHELLLQQLDAKDTIIHDFVQNVTEFMRTSIDASEKDSPKVIRRRINESIKEITTPEFWTALKSYEDSRFHNLISDIAQNPKITEIDLKYIELFCLGFNYIEIAIIIGVNPNYVSTKRKSLAKKLSINVPLQEFLEQQMSTSIYPD